MERSGMQWSATCSNNISINNISTIISNCLVISPDTKLCTELETSDQSSGINSETICLLSTLFILCTCRGGRAFHLDIRNMWSWIYTIKPYIPLFIAVNLHLCTLFSKWCCTGLYFKHKTQVKVKSSPFIFQLWMLIQDSVLYCHINMITWNLSWWAEQNTNKWTSHS